MTKKSLIIPQSRLIYLPGSMEWEIFDRFGLSGIAAKREDICIQCRRRDFGCHLLPITTQGEDCPYFASEGG